MRGALARTSRVVEANARLYRRGWRGSVTTTFATPVLFLLAMGLGLGTLVDARGTGQQLAGGSYRAFLAPGLLVASGVQLAASESMLRVRYGLAWGRGYWAALNTPLGTDALLAGGVVWMALRLTVAAVVFALIAALLGIVPAGRGLLAVPPAVLAGVAVTPAFTALALWASSDYVLSATSRFVVMPMFLFSGTFFPLDQLPAALRPVAQALPLWHGVELARAAALGVPTAWPRAVHLAWLVAVTAGGLLVARLVFAAKMRT